MEGSPESKIQSQFATRVPIYDKRSAWILDEGLIEKIVGAYEPRPHAQLLDVCCGTGVVGGAFAGLVERRIGVDLSESMLGKARERLDEVHVGNAYQLQFPSESFDVVVSRQALHFMDFPSRVIAEMHRVLRPDGQIILAQRVPYGDADATWMTELNRLKQPSLKTFILDEHLQSGLEDAQFESINKRDYQLWESISAWVDSPEVPVQNRDRIVRLVQEAPTQVRAVHPIRVTESGDVQACWRWVIFTARKTGSARSAS